MNAPAQIVLEGALPVRLVEKPWGRDTLPAPFTAAAEALGGKRIGEIWFEPPPALPGLLVKYIFTSDRLSVQVHPSDAQTQAAGEGRQGKEECWLVIDAEPDAVLGIGFDRAIDAETMRAAARDGSIERLLTWHKVAPGDFYYIPANTVHAIGAGVSVIEIQQNSDITYRLFDYGRPRELHLERGIDVAKGGVYPAALHRHLAPGAAETLVEGPYFRLDALAGPPSAAVAAAYRGQPLLAIPVDGAITIGDSTIEPGGCGLADGIDAIGFAAAGRCLVAAPAG